MYNSKPTNSTCIYDYRSYHRFKRFLHTQRQRQRQRLRTSANCGWMESNCLPLITHIAENVFHIECCLSYWYWLRVTFVLWTILLSLSDASFVPLQVISPVSLGSLSGYAVRLRVSFYYPDSDVLDS